MPYGENYGAITRTLAVWRAGNNPDGRKRGAKLDMPPDLFGRMMRGEVTVHQAQQEWREREPAQRAFNDQLRSQAGVGFVADTTEALDPEGQPAIRDASSGEFADLGEAAREAVGLQETGGLPTEQPAAAPDPNQGIRDAFWRMKGQRAA